MNRGTFWRGLPPLAALLLAGIAAAGAWWLAQRGPLTPALAPKAQALAPARVAPIALLEVEAPPAGAAPRRQPDGAGPGTRPTPSSGVRVAPPRPARRHVQRRSRLPVGPLRSFVYSSFRSAKAGDADSIYRLGLALKECSEVDATPQALKTSIDRVYRTREFAGMRVDDPADTAMELQRRYERCEGIAPDVRDRYYEVIARAADQGSIEALESMVFQMPPDKICRERELSMCDGSARAGTLELRRQQARWLQEAQQRGSLNALWQLGAAYMNGEMVSADKTQSFVYFRAYQIVAEAFRLEDKVGRLVRDLRSALPHDERTAAEARARHLVANPNCCVYLR